MNVDRFGLHQIEGGIPLLVQEGGAQHALPIEMDIPVRVTSQDIRCPHEILLSSSSPCVELDRSPLVEFMMPEPKRAGDPILYAAYDIGVLTYVQQLLRLSSSKEDPFPIFMLNNKRMANLLSSTNLNPLVLIVSGTKNSQNILQHACQLANVSPRRLLVLGPALMPIYPGMRKAEFDLGDIGCLPLEQIGSNHLRSLMS